MWSSAAVAQILEHRCGFKSHLIHDFSTCHVFGIRGWCGIILLRLRGQLQNRTALLICDISISTHEQLPLQRLWFYEAVKPTLKYVWNSRGVCWELGGWFVFQIIKKIWARADNPSKIFQNFQTFAHPACRPRLGQTICVLRLIDTRYAMKDMIPDGYN